MEIVKLPVGVAAKPEDDCIRIQQCADGTFLLGASFLATCEDGVEESVGIIGSQPYDSYEDAEAAGLACASECGVQVVHVSQSDGTEPLPEPARST